MGRPLNKKFFGDDAGRLLATLAYLPGADAAVPCHILRQRSNLKYEVANDAAPIAVTGTQADAKYIIEVPGDTDFTAIGAPNNDAGTRFTATGAGAGSGTVREYAVCKLQQATPAADFEMNIEVIPENAQAPAQATVTFTVNAGAVDNITSFDGGYGYWEDGTGVAITGGGGDATINYQVANGSIVAVQLVLGGSGYTAGTAAIADAPAATPPPQTARIINAHHVKTFEGNTFAWPAEGGDGSGGRAQFTEADIDEQT